MLIGLQRGGVWIAERLAAVISDIEPGSAVPVGRLDVSLYRDDIGLRPVVPGAATDIPVPLEGATVVLVDDVLFTGRTVRGCARGDERLRPPPGGAAGGARRPWPP